MTKQEFLDEVKAILKRGYEAQDPRWREPTLVEYERWTCASLDAQNALEVFDRRDWAFLFLRGIEPITEERRYYFWEERFDFLNDDAGPALDEELEGDLAQLREFCGVE